MTEPEEKAALFPGASPATRAEVLMKDGRISVEAMPFVAAHIEAAVAETARARPGSRALIQCGDCGALFDSLPRPGGCPHCGAKPGGKG